MCLYLQNWTVISFHKLYLFQRIQYNEHTYTPHPQPITCLRALRDFTILGAIPRHLMNLKCKFQSMWVFLQIVIWKYFFNTQEFKCHVLLLCLKWQSHLTYKLTSRTQRQKCQDRDVLALSKKHTWKCGQHSMQEWQWAQRKRRKKPSWQLGSTKQFSSLSDEWALSHGGPTSPVLTTAWTHFIVAS